MLWMRFVSLARLFATASDDGQVDASTVMEGTAKKDCYILFYLHEELLPR